MRTRIPQKSAQKRFHSQKLGEVYLSDHWPAFEFVCSSLSVWETTASFGFTSVCILKAPARGWPSVLLLSVWLEHCSLSAPILRLPLGSKEEPRSIYCCIAASAPHSFLVRIAFVTQRRCCSCATSSCEWRTLMNTVNIVNENTLW